jgi:hypothetical protein
MHQHLFLAAGDKCEQHLKFEEFAQHCAVVHAPLLRQ